MREPVRAVIGVVYGLTVIWSAFAINHLWISGSDWYAFPVFITEVAILLVGIFVIMLI